MLVKKFGKNAKSSCKVARFMLKFDYQILKGKDMKKTQKLLALALGSLLVVSSLAAIAGCGGGETATAARICYDNLPDDNIAVPEAYTKYKLSGVKDRVETNAEGETVEQGTVVDYKDGYVIAKGAGVAMFDLGGGKSFRMEVVPAYATNPHNQYNTTSGNDYGYSSKYLGQTHDPSLIEVEENGKPAYYIFSTGWNSGNDIHRSEDLITWSYIGKATNSTTKMPDIEEWEEETNTSIQWWAPDIVPAYGGGYWLYTCCVSNGHHTTNNTEYSKACIVLFHSRTLAKESFKYVGVLMQSAIPKGGAGEIDVNSIDPQIIYSKDGKMYMAYGSFGTGNWMLELDPKTGLRKDSIYKDNEFLSLDEVREYEGEAEEMYTGILSGDTVKSEYYGTLISLRAMEAPVIARHDNVTVMDENEKVLEKNKTYYYSMHSYNGLDVAYQMWGGRSESVWGVYRSVCGSAESGGIVCNYGVGSQENGGNKYMGRFTWDGANAQTSIDIVKPGHNDLFTTSADLNVAAYITRTNSFPGDNEVFVSQIHQYYLNSMGHIVINPNRYGGEIDRAVTQEELFAYGGRFKMVAFSNDNNDKRSVEVVLSEDGNVSYNGTQIGTWKMYGNGYICFDFTNIGAVPMLASTGECKYYGVVRTAWLDDQNKSGFTITCMGQTMNEDKADPSNNTSMAMFMNNISTLSGDGLVG